MTEKLCVKIEFPTQFWLVEIMSTSIFFNFSANNVDIIVFERGFLYQPVAVWRGSEISQNSSLEKERVSV